MELPGTLVLWRNKLRASARPQRTFDAVRELVRASGAIKGKTRPALGSTVLDDAMARQDTIDMLVTQIRRVPRFIRELAFAAGARRQHRRDRPPAV